MLTLPDAFRKVAVAVTTTIPIFLPAIYSAVATPEASVVALIVRKKALIHIGLCETHRAGRRWAITGSWLAVLLGVVLLFVGFSTHGAFALVGVILLLAGAVFGVIKGRVIAPTKIEKDIAWLKGAGPAFLETLPNWIGPQ